MQKYIKYVGPTCDLKLQHSKYKKNFLPKQLVIKILLLAFIIGIFGLSLQNVGDFMYLRSNFIMQVKSDLKEDLQLDSLYKNKYIWEIDVNAVKASILKLQKFKDVNVKVVLPNILHVSAVKRKPYAIWWNYKKFFLVDNEGIVLNESFTEADKTKYILIVGDNAVSNISSIMKVVNESKQNGKVASMRFIGKRRWDLVLNNGITLKLPEKNMSQAMALFDSLLALKHDFVNDDCTVDMRLAPEKIFIKNTNKK